MTVCPATNHHSTLMPLTCAMMSVLPALLASSRFVMNVTTHVRHVSAQLPLIVYLVKAHSYSHLKQVNVYRYVLALTSLSNLLASVSLNHYQNATNHVTHVKDLAPINVSPAVRLNPTILLYKPAVMNAHLDITVLRKYASHAIKHA